MALSLLRRQRSVFPHLVLGSVVRKVADEDGGEVSHYCRGGIHSAGASKSTTPIKRAAGDVASSYSRLRTCARVRSIDCAMCVYCMCDLRFAILRLRALSHSSV
jgi:hypothetical protein